MLYNSIQIFVVTFFTILLPYYCIFRFPDTMRASASAETQYCSTVENVALQQFSTVAMEHICQWRAVMSLFDVFLR